MSSATINRPSGGLTNQARTTRFGDFPSSINRMNGEDKPTQLSSVSQGFSNNNTWQTAGGIWGNNAIGSGLGNGKRDASRPRVSENDSFDGKSGSSVLAAYSEADSWGSRTNGPWNVDTTSPTSHSGSTSPVRHRGSIHSIPTMVLTESQTVSPYISSSRAAIGQGPGIPNRVLPKSGLDPSSGPFKFPYASGQSFGFSDDKENRGFSRDSRDMDTGSARTYGIDQRGSNATYRNMQGSVPSESSLPPSRHSDTSLSGTNNSAYLSNGLSPFGHSQNSSIHTQRPGADGRMSSFSSASGARSYSDQIQEIGGSLAGMHVNEKVMYMDSPGSETFPSQMSNAHYDAQSAATSTNNWKGDVPVGGPFGAYNGAYQPSYATQLNMSRPPRLNDREPISPGASYRAGPSSPKYYSDTGTPVMEMDQGMLLRPQSTADFERNYHRQQFNQPHNFYQSSSVYNSLIQAQYAPHGYDYAQHQQPLRAVPGPYGYQVPAPAYGAAVVAPRGPSRDQDLGHGVRSVLLEEFRSNTKSNKRYELKDIYNHIVEFSGDQHGSRFIQQKLESANSDEKDQIFREIQPNALQLMTDVFGNYVIQKLFEHGNQIQKRILAEQMRNHVDELSIQMYGCRVVQKALEHVLADQQAELVKELQPDVLKCVKDQNGNHVIQKAIERVPTEHIQFIIDAFKGQVHTLATHPYGCRVIQRMLEYCSEADQAAVLSELFACASMLITDQYGNYVIQHVIAHGKPEDKARVIKIVTAQLLTLSKHKFASNVVEQSIQFGTDEQRGSIVAQMTVLHSDGSSPLQMMMKDQFGNYVVQKLLGQLKGAERERLIEDIKPQLVALKKYNYGKQIAAIEKVIYNGQSGPPYNQSAINQAPSALPNGLTTNTVTMPLDISSTSPTPLLTMEQNSPQSSSLPSTSASTVDGPTERKSIIEPEEETMTAEVKIENA